MKFHDFSPFYRSSEGIKPKVSGDRLLDNPLVADVQSGASFHFDGSDDVVLISDNTAIDDVFDGGGTVSAWIKPDSTGESYGRILDKVGAATGFIFYVTGDSSKYQIRLIKGFSTTDGMWVTGSSNTDYTYSYGDWLHVALVYDASSDSNDPTIYVDGVAVDVDNPTSPSGTSRSDNGYDLRIGNNSSATRTFDGEIRQVRIHNRALTAAEVRAAYSGQAVLYEYVGASQTSLVTGTDSDFTGASNWVNGNNVSAVMNYDSGDAGHSSTMQVDATGTAWSHAQLTKSNFTVGKKYRISFDYKIVSGSNQQIVVVSNADTNNRPLSESLSGSGWQSYESTFTSNDSAQRIWVYANYAASGSTSDEIFLILPHHFHSPHNFFYLLNKSH